MHEHNYKIIRRSMTLNRNDMVPRTLSSLPQNMHYFIMAHHDHIIEFSTLDHTSSQKKIFHLIVFLRG